MTTDSRVVVSCTSIPSRMEHLVQVVENMCMQQSRPPDFLRLYLPHSFVRTGAQYIVPQALLDLEKAFKAFRIVRVTEDKGPITKVFYALEEFSKPTDVVISIDDDIVYNVFFVEELLRAHAQNPTSLLGFMGNDPPSRPFIHAESVPNPALNVYGLVQVKGLGGYRGILYPRVQIAVDFFTLFEQANAHSLNECKAVVQEDDLFIAAYCELKQIPMHVIGTFHHGDLQSPSWLERLNFRFRATAAIDGLYGSEGHKPAMVASTQLLKTFFQQQKNTV